MKIKAKRQTVEYLDVEVDPKDVVEIVGNTLGFCYGNYVNEGNNLYYTYMGDNHHNGDPEYDTRKATAEELNDWLTFIKIRRKLMKEK